jgi:hypothetical protein
MARSERVRGASKGAWPAREGTERTRGAGQEQFDSEQGYKAALLSTLKRARDLVATGKL